MSSRPFSCTHRSYDMFCSFRSYDFRSADVRLQDLPSIIAAANLVYGRAIRKVLLCLQYRAFYVPVYRLFSKERCSLPLGSFLRPRFQTQEIERSSSAS